jgi:hypothetical protein
MKNIKAQVQLGESTAVIIVVIILLVIGIVFWNKVNGSDIQKLSSQSQELSTIEIANAVSELPELKCSESGVDKVKCLDWHKIIAMNDTINNPADKKAYLFYNNYFKNSKITVRELYPYERNITIYDANLSKSTKTLLIPIPISIKNYITKETDYGLIVVEGYYTN